jgi:hypothetical protein
VLWLEKWIMLGVDLWRKSKVHHNHEMNNCTLNRL